MEELNENTSKQRWLSKYNRETIYTTPIKFVKQDFYELRQRVKQRITHCKIIIDIVQQNHSDWYLVDTLIECYIPNGIKLCQTRKYTELIEQCNMHIQADTPFADTVNNIADTSFIEMQLALPTIMHRITVPEKYNTRENRKIIAHGSIDKVMTLRDYTDILTTYGDEESLFVLEKINKWVVDLENIW